MRAAQKHQSLHNRGAMEGNPILRDGQNTVRGDVIKFYIHENRSEVLSGTQRRVEAIFYSPSKGEGK